MCQHVSVCVSVCCLRCVVGCVSVEGIFPLRFYLIQKKRIKLQSLQMYINSKTIKSAPRISVIIFGEIVPIFLLTSVSRRSPPAVLLAQEGPPVLEQRDQTLPIRESLTQSVGRSSTQRQTQEPEMKTKWCRHASANVRHNTHQHASCTSVQW